MKWFYVISVLVVIALTATPYLLLRGIRPEEHAGKVVRYGIYGSAIRSIDPATCGDTSSSGIQGNFYEGLYTYHYLKRPAYANVIPQLAAEMPQISRDGLTYTIKIRPGVNYHRNPCFGTEPDPAAPGRKRFKTRTVTAEDFVLSFKRVADYHINTGLSWAFATRIKGLQDYREQTRKYKIGDFSRYDLPLEGVQALGADQRTLQIKLAEPYPQFLYVLAMHVYAPIPREAVDYWLATEPDGTGGRRPIDVEKRRTEFREAEQVVGTGAYVFKEFVRKNRIVLVRNPDFRQEHYPTEGAPGDKEAGLLDDAGKRVPFIDVMRFDFIAEDYSAWMLFLARQRDTSGIPREAFDFVLTPDKDLENSWKKKSIVLKTYTQPVVYWIVFNMEDKVIQASKSLRQALCASFSVEDYIKVISNGRGIRAVNILPNSVIGWKEAGPGPYYQPNKLELAKRKLEEAKQELAAAGLLVDGKIPQLSIDLGDTGSGGVMQREIFKQQFAKIGIKLKVNLNDWPTLQGKVHNKQCQMYTMGWHADYPDAENFLQLYYSENIDKGTNNSNYSNPEFDRLYETVRIMPDSPQRTKLYAEMVDILSEDCPVLMLSQPVSYVLSYTWVKNSKPHPVGYGYGKYIRIDTAERRRLGGKE